jgi:hypothetical protein
MIKTKYLIFIFVLLTSQFAQAILVVDSVDVKNLVPYSWTPISDVDKVTEYAGKEIPKRTAKLLTTAEQNYTSAFSKMKNKEYSEAIIDFNSAMKDYKRAKLNDDALNYINANLALCYAHTGNKGDLAVIEKFLSKLTNTIYLDNKWAYNIAIAWSKTNKKNEATSLLSQIIRDDEYNYQAYVTLEEIYKNSGNLNNAKKVKQRMHNAQARQTRVNQVQAKKNKNGTSDRKKIEKKIFPAKGIKPNILNLRIVTQDDPLKYEGTKLNNLNDRNTSKVQEGVDQYNDGTKALSNKEYSSAQSILKNAEKNLKRGKISENGLSHIRANLAIAYLSSGDKRGANQAKRYLKYITPKIFKEGTYKRDWTYNLAVAYYTFGATQKSKNTKKEFMDKAIKYLRWAIKHDKLFLPAHESLIYIYKEINEDAKAKNAQNSYEKARNELIKSFSREEQIAQGGEPRIFRVHLGTYGEFDTPAGLFEQENIIIIPISSTKTTYLAGIFENLQDAITYQKKMKKSGYQDPYIISYKEGEKVEF